MAEMTVFLTERINWPKLLNMNVFNSCSDLFACYHEDMLKFV